MKKHITARVDEEIIKLAKKAASLENRSFNNFLENALDITSKEVIKNNKNK